ncbi:DNA N-glycosylase and apurinic/apyrimidinic (AP) lyase [Epicoccum nigrum]|nr:DNA N-glycosylase and apurinic/apyrimidinic (AP) lyase [Epicoccum nigrum]
MVWPRKPPSTSRPRPTSTGPEMERPLPTTTSKNNRYTLLDMYCGAGGDTQAPTDRTPNIPVEAHGSSAPEGLPAASTDNQHVDKAQALGPDHDILTESEVTSRKDVGDNSDGSASPVVNLPRSKNAKTVQRKAKHSLPRLLVLSACVSYLFIQVWGTTLGLHFVNGYASAHVRQGESDMAIASEDLAIERTMYAQLEQLKNTELQWQYMESYPNCLVRGLFTAKKSFPVRGFDMHPNVRNQTLNWISENCDRLFYTPQLHPSNMSLLRKVAEDAKQVARDAFALFNVGAEPVSPENASLLSAFRLDRDEYTRCRLVYSGEKYSIDGWSEAASKAFANVNKDILKWSFPFDKYLHTSKVLLFALYFLHASLLVCSAIALHLSLPQLKPPPGQSPKSILADLKLRIRQLFNHREMSANIDLFWAEAILCMPLRWQLLSDSLSSCNMLLSVGLVLIAIFPTGFGMAFFFPVPGSKRNAHSLYRAMTELKEILQRDEAFLDSLSKKGASTPKAPPAPAATPASKIRARHISPATSLAEDLQQARETLHAEREQASDNDEAEHTSTSSGETVSDFDSDTDSGASYVDLTDGATPTISEEGDQQDGEWAVVQD